MTHNVQTQFDRWTECQAAIQEMLAHDMPAYRRKLLLDTRTTLWEEPEKHPTPREFFCILRMRAAVPSIVSLERSDAVI